MRSDDCKLRNDIHASMTFSMKIYSPTWVVHVSQKCILRAQQDGVCFVAVLLLSCLLLCGSKRNKKKNNTERKRFYSPKNSVTETKQNALTTHRDQ